MILSSEMGSGERVLEGVRAGIFDTVVRNGLWRRCSGGGEGLDLRYCRQKWALESGFWRG